MVDMLSYIPSKLLHSNDTNSTTEAFSEFGWIYPRLFLHLCSVASNLFFILKFDWHHGFAYEKTMIVAMCACFVAIGLTGVLEFLREFQLLEFMNRTVLLVLTMIIPQALAFTNWQFYVCVQRRIYRRAAYDLGNGEGPYRQAKTNLAILANVISSFLVYILYMIIRYNTDDGNNLMKLAPMVIPIAYSIIGCALFALTYHNIGKRYPEVEQLKTVSEMGANRVTNIITMMKFYNRAGLVVNVTMILVGILMYYKEHITVGASIGGIIISLSLLISQYVQHRKNGHNETAQTPQIPGPSPWSRPNQNRQNPAPVSRKHRSRSNDVHPKDAVIHAWRESQNSRATAEHSTSNGNLAREQSQDGKRPSIESHNSTRNTAPSKQNAMTARFWEWRRRESRSKKEKENIELEVWTTENSQQVPKPKGILKEAGSRAPPNNGQSTSRVERIPSFELEIHDEDV